MIRKTGYYYVKHRDCWEVAMYLQKTELFFRPGIALAYEESDFKAVKDEPVKLPEH